MKHHALHAASAPALTARPTRARLQVRPRVRIVRAKSGQVLRPLSSVLRSPSSVL